MLASSLLKRAVMAAVTLFGVAVVVFLLVWQAFLYLSAVQTSVWSYLAHEPARATEHAKVDLVPERSVAA